MAVFNNFHNEQTLKLDVKQQQPNAIPRFVQYDSALLKIELYDNGKKYNVSRAEEFVVSIKRPDGRMLSGLAEYDGEFINYKLSKQDLDVLGETQARLQVYEGRNRLSSLNFRYDVYEDYETVGDIEEQTLLSQLFARLWDALTEAQRQGNYAENRGDFANDAGDYAMDAGDSQKMRWLHWVKTVSERNSKYPRPRNGDTVYVVNVSDKNGGAVYRYNSIQSPAKWEEIAGWDTSIIQDIYNLIATKEDKVEVARLVKKLEDDLDGTYFGARNLIMNTDLVSDNDFIYSPVVSSSDVSFVNTDAGRMVQARQAPDENRNSYFGATVGNLNGKRISVKAGEELTLSFIGNKSVTSTDFTYVYLMRTEGSNRKMSLSKVYDINDYSKKYEFTVTAPWDSDNAYLLIGSNKEDGYEGHAYWIRFRDVKLEKGNRATDWSPAFEDLINNYKDLIKELKDEKDGDITRHNSRIKQLEDKIVMTVTEKKYDDEMKLIGEWQSEYEQTARNIQTTVSKKVGNDEIISRINQSAESVSIDANKINLNGYVTISNLRNGNTKVHPNALADFGMTTINGGDITIDRLNVRRPNGKDLMVMSGEIIADYSAQRYEPQFSARQENHQNGRVWNPEGQYFSAPMVAIYGKNGHSSWGDNLAGYDGYVDARGEDAYTLVQAYAIRENARYLVVSYGVQTQEAGILVRVAESGGQLMSSRTHNFRDDDSVWGNTYWHVIDLEAANSRFGSRRLFYVKAVGVGADRALGWSATRKLRMRILGVYTTDNPPGM